MGMVPSRKNSSINSSSTLGHHSTNFRGRLCFVGERGGDFFDGRLAVAIGLDMWAFMATRSITPRNLFRCRSGAAAATTLRPKTDSSDSMERSKLESSRSIKGEHEGAGDVVLGAIIPDFFSGDLRADVGVDGDQRGVGGDQRGFGFGDEGGIAG